MFSLTSQQTYYTILCGTGITISVTKSEVWNDKAGFVIYLWFFSCASTDEGKNASILSFIILFTFVTYLPGFVQCSIDHGRCINVHHILDLSSYLTLDFILKGIYESSHSRFESAFVWTKSLLTTSDLLYSSYSYERICILTLDPVWLIFCLSVIIH